ncbi:MAG: hypothetical protein H7281_11435 [Bacteriovorax sp.]|nr:hypothetical protein [Bacteriovorax sp.]
MKVYLLFLLLCFHTPGYSYSELSRHGYVNCTACHLSPSGGGIMTPYGRELSRAVVSTWGAKNEQYFAYNAIPALSKNEKILVGAFVRGLQAIRNDKQATEARAILMQADVDVAYNEKNWAVLTSLGRQEIRSGLNSDSRLFSRRHYAIYRYNFSNQFRAGKFLQFYGLNDPNHQLYVRKYLNFGFDTESYNAEYSYLGENFNFYLTSSFGNFGDIHSQNTEKGISASTSYFFWDKQKVGLSTYRGTETFTNRITYGVWGIFSFHPKIFTMHELDFQNKKIKSSGIKQSGYVTSNKINYEYVRGLIGFLSYDLANLNPANISSRKFAYGAGVQFFPRPHFELISAWQKEEIVHLKSQSDLFSFILHFYL